MSCMFKTRTSQNPTWGYFINQRRSCCLSPPNLVFSLSFVSCVAQPAYIFCCDHGIASQTGSEHVQRYPARVSFMSQWLAFVFGLFLTIPGLLISSQDYVAIVLKLRSGQIWQLASVCHPFVTHKHPDAMCPPGSRSLAGLRALAGAAIQCVCSQLYFLGHVIDWGHMQHIYA